MISALWNGVTGLNSHERALDTQSNNVSNSSTIGHKKDEVSFQDLMYQSRYGKGSTIQSVEKNFNQGSLQLTNNTLDVAIDGNGFFMVQDPENGEKYFTRAGNFKIGKEGTLQSIGNNLILGNPTTISNIASTNPADTQFTSEYSTFIGSTQAVSTSFAESINAKSTDYTRSAMDSGTSGTDFKSADSKKADIEALIANYKEKLDLYSSNPLANNVSSVSQETQINFSDFNTQLQDNGSYIEVYVNNSLVRQYFDTNQQTTMNKFADKLSAVQGLSGQVNTLGVITIETLVPGRDVDITGAAINDNGYGPIQTRTPVIGGGIGMINSARDALDTALENAGAKLLEMTNRVSYLDAGLRNVEDGVSSIQLQLNSLSIAENVLGELSIDDGLIYSNDGDNKFLVGKIETASFTNPESLLAIGGNRYTKSKETGDSLNADSINKLIGGSIELSNTDYSESLVDLMVYQRAFEANSKTVTTSDEFLRTAIELKK